MTTDNAPTAETIDPNGPGPAAQKWAEAGEKADAYERERIAAALKGKHPAEQAAPVAVEKPAPTPEPAETEPTEPDAEASEGAGEETEASERVKSLHALAKELGMKVDARGVATAERVGFRQEKRAWQEKARAREADFNQRLQATQQYFAPLHPAVEAIKAGDWDQAVKKLAEFAKDDEVAREGLNGATKRYLKRAAGEDPRVDELSRKLAQREAEEAERAQKAQLAWQQQEEQRVRAEFTKAKAAELEQLEDLHVKRLAKVPNFAPRVVAYMEEQWDGYETVSLEEAAEHVAKQARAAYDELHQVFGDRDSDTNPETPETTQVAGRPSKRDVGKKPKPHNGKHATEASPPGRTLTAEEWRRKHAALMATATD